MNCSELLCCYLQIRKYVIFTIQERSRHSYAFLPKDHATTFTFLICSFYPNLPLSFPWQIPFQVSSFSNCPQRWPTYRDSLSNNTKCLTAISSSATIKKKSVKLKVTLNSFESLKKILKRGWGGERWGEKWLHVTFLLHHGPVPIREAISSSMEMRISGHYRFRQHGT